MSRTMNSDDSCTLNPVSPIMSNITGGVPEAEEMAEDDVQCTPCGDEYGMRSAKVLRGPKEPTAEEIAEHNVKHVPYRSWCPRCVAAAGKATSHQRNRNGEQSAIPYHHIDYWFMRDERGGNSIPVVVMKDSDTKAFGAHVVTQNGNIDWVAEKLCEDIENFGHSGKVVLKSDQENALVDLLGEVKLKRSQKNQETLCENSKIYDSQTNGVSERAVQSIECITRTHKLALERKLRKRIPCDHPIMSWLVEHGADLLNKYQVGKDGRTAFERIKGKRYHGEMYEFGRKVYHMDPGKHGGGLMQARWGVGIFLGKLNKSDEAMIFTDTEKIVKVRSVKLMLEAESWDAELVDKLQTHRWKAQFSEREVQLEERDGEGDEDDGPVPPPKIPETLISPENT